MENNAESLHKKYKLDERQVRCFWNTYSDDAKRLFERYNKITEQLKNQGEIPQDYSVSDAEIKFIVALHLKNMEEINSRREFDKLFEGWF